MEHDTYTITIEQPVTDENHTDALSELLLRLTLETARSPLEELVMAEHDACAQPTRHDSLPQDAVPFSYSIEGPTYAWEYEDVPAAYNTTDKNGYEHARDGEERTERAAHVVNELAKQSPSSAGCDDLSLPIEVREDAKFLKSINPVKFQLLYDSPTLRLVLGLRDSTRVALLTTI